MVRACPSRAWTVGRLPRPLAAHAALAHVPCGPAPPQHAPHWLGVPRSAGGSTAALLDDLPGFEQHELGDCEAERLGGTEVDVQPRSDLAVVARLPAPASRPRIE